MQYVGYIVVHTVLHIDAMHFAYAMIKHSECSAYRTSRIALHILQCMVHGAIWYALNTFCSLHLALHKYKCKARSYISDAFVSRTDMFQCIDALK